MIKFLFFRKNIFKFLCVYYIIISLSCKRNNNINEKHIIKSIDTASTTRIIKNSSEFKKITQNEISEFNFLVNKLLNEKIISVNNFKIDTLIINEHPLVTKLLKRNLLKSDVSCKVLSIEYICKGSKIKNQFQVFYFADENQSSDTYRIFDNQVNSSSWFEKPYKFFFRFKNKIFYTTSDTKITCSGRVIESLAEHFNYEVDYFKRFYASGKERIKYR